MNKDVDELIKNLRSAADELESIKNTNSPKEIKHMLENPGGLMSCCGTCTLVSPTAPCANTCIEVSPLF